MSSNKQGHFLYVVSSTEKIEEGNTLKLEGIVKRVTWLPNPFTAYIKFASVNDDGDPLLGVAQLTVQ